jgi:hypothetical protein
MTNPIPPKTYLDDVFATTYPETFPFWAAAEQKRLLIKTCAHCNRAHWYPRIVCPLCGSDQTTWKDASGRGTIYSFSVIERADPPYVIAWVQMEEGPIAITNIVDCDFKTIKIGDSVSVRFLQTPEGRTVPVYTPD